MVAIIDYGLGNLKSIYNMFKKAGISSIITSSPHEIENADRYLLPGVGSFDHGINNLINAPFFNVLEKQVLEYEKPILCVCLGMQLLTKGSEEGVKNGLGWINARTIKFVLNDKQLSIPHMGWNTVRPLNTNSIFRDLQISRFYFVHSYHVVCNNDDNILATSNYGMDFTSSICKKNIYGVQFHPEKSHKYGLQLFKNFGEI